jgi:hypothetical protein
VASINNQHPHYETHAYFKFLAYLVLVTSKYFPQNGYELLSALEKRTKIPYLPSSLREFYARMCPYLLFPNSTDRCFCYSIKLERLKKEQKSKNSTEVNKSGLSRKHQNLISLQQHNLLLTDENTLSLCTDTLRRPRPAPTQRNISKISQQRDKS